MTTPSEGPGDRSAAERERARAEREAHRSRPAAAERDARRSRPAGPPQRTTRAHRPHRPHLPHRTHRGRRPTTRLGRVGVSAFSVAVLVVVAVVVWLLVSIFQPGAGPGHGRVVVKIPAGASTHQIGDLLARKGVVSSADIFLVRAKLAGNLKPGTYTLRRGMSYGATIAALEKGRPPPRIIRVTLAEGLSRRQAAPIVHAAGVRGDYLSATRSSPALDTRRYGAPADTPSLEGFLFPATYDLKPGATVGRLVDEQLGAFKQRFAGVELRAARRAHLTPYDVVIIASLVEREAKAQADRPLIAAVIYNRLKDHMNLGIDATIQYATGNYGGSLTESQLRTDSPYNTRTHPGLPPTPIASPGMPSIQAAAHPAKVNYLYYVLRPCSDRHAFSSSYAQFQRDEARYQAAQKKCR